MKSIKIFFLLMLLAFSVISEAQQPQQLPMGAGMDTSQLTEYLKGVQTHMLMMQDLSNKILSEKNSEKQQALKDQQLELMRGDYANDAKPKVG